VFFPGRPFQSRLIHLGKAKSGAPER
jgi:hypothetical protein